MRVTNEHWEVLLNFAENHPSIITNQFVGHHGKKNLRCLWEDLTKLLNSLGYGEKRLEDWKKTLVDWKSKTKAKAAKIRLHQSKTGGGERSFIILSPFEQHLLQLMGNVAVQGDKGLNKIGVKRTASSSQKVYSPKKLRLNEIGGHSAENEDLLQLLAEENEIQALENETLDVMEELDSNTVLEDPMDNEEQIKKSKSTIRRREQNKFQNCIEEMNEKTLTL
ncbi:uncharacterized protein [Prorops nasuta]|uniref:uncharacterized protein n=1 Tax=Prorops nasuta TaxID=863751 RepID=UPI0034CDCC83